MTARASAGEVTQERLGVRATCAKQRKIGGNDGYQRTAHLPSELDFP
jgi:hypothetical protein